MGKRQIEITAAVSAVIPTGTYENLKPLYSVKETIEVDELPNELGLRVDIDAMISKRTDELRAMVNSKLDSDYQEQKIMRIKAQRKDMRFYERGGKQYPSVTSIISAIEPIDYDPMLLQQYAARGNIVHKQIAHYFKTGTFEKDISKVPGTKLDYLILSQGSLKLSWEDCNFLGWWEDNSKDIKLGTNASDDSEVTVFNDEHLFAGTADLICLYKDKKAVIDFKTASNYDAEKLDKYWRQVAAYCRTVGAEVMIVAPLNPKNKCGYGKTLVEDSVEKYFNLFLQDRAAFKQVYGV